MEVITMSAFAVQLSLAVAVKDAGGVAPQTALVISAGQIISGS